MAETGVQIQNQANKIQAGPSLVEVERRLVCQAYLSYHLLKLAVLQQVRQVVVRVICLPVQIKTLPNRRTAGLWLPKAKEKLGANP